MKHVIIQIQRWLMHIKVWRVVGFTSAVVGLVCYALSSSFNHLFGNWNLCAGFSYSLIIIRSSFPSVSVDVASGNEHPGLQDEHSVVVDIFSQQLVCTDIASSMMEQLRTCVKAIQQENLNVINSLLEQKIEFFDNASELMLSEQSSEGVVMLELLLPESETINNLQDIVKLMVSAGFEKECANVYGSCMRECLEECLINQLLGLENRTIEDVNMIPWKDLKDPIRRWIKTSKVALNILFPTERQLCDLVFLGFSTASDLSFTEICRGCTNHLLKFADAVAKGSRSAEQLFKYLDMFEALRDLIPKFESLFSNHYRVSLRNEANTVLKNLGEAIVGIFIELENRIRSDPVKAAVPGGRLHPVVRYVMNYLVLTCDYWHTLEQVFEDYGQMLKEYRRLDDRAPPSSLFSLQMVQILEVLYNNLEAKSKIYNEPALCCVFLMNSSRYILQKTKDNELGKLLPDDVIQNHEAKVLYNHEQYLKSSWSEVLGFLKLDDNRVMPPTMVKKSMKKKLKSFNIMFEEICRAQSLWFVLDEQLREIIRVSIERNLLPAYGNFIGRFESVLEHGKFDDDKYVKYQMEDIESRLNDLFQGSSGSTKAQN
ncbi:exocyst complex component EXO70B1-like isoform X2 [Vicia villosa]|uniref:exocyst complex component EXO70B1-like isoform X2 n=1 Tax=Vicia villosa TaxID=3911 RepID=UPI00273B8F7E|nr:exocyst complex component EXO70B1-like isoform X2 [Vicia villosa]